MLIFEMLTYFLKNKTRLLKTGKLRPQKIFFLIFIGQGAMFYRFCRIIRENHNSGLSSFFPFKSFIFKDIYPNILKFSLTVRTFLPHSNIFSLNITDFMTVQFGGQ
jgi:hypothetical protein